MRGAVGEIDADLLAAQRPDAVAAAMPRILEADRERARKGRHVVAARRKAARHETAIAGTAALQIAAGIAVRRQAQLETDGGGDIALEQAELGPPRPRRLDLRRLDPRRCSRKVGQAAAAQGKTVDGGRDHRARRQRGVPNRRHRRRHSFTDLRRHQRRAAERDEGSDEQRQGHAEPRHRACLLLPNRAPSRNERRCGTRPSAYPR